MRILIVSQYFWPEQFRINDLALALKERGHEVTVLTGMPNYPSGRLFEGYSWFKKHCDNMAGISIYRVPLFLRRQGRGWQLALNYLSFALSACLLGCWFLRKQKFDVVFVFEPSPFTVGIPAILLRRLKRAPMLFWVQDLWPESLSATGAVKSKRVLALVGRMVRMIYRHCDRVLIQSRGFMERVVQSGADRERVRYFPNWAESFYQPVEHSLSSDTGEEMPDGFRMMFAGNLGSAQSLGTIVEAAELLKDDPEMQWVIVGNGRQKQWMENQVERRGLQKCFHFLGAKSAELMPNYLSQADALLVTLRSDPIFALTIPSKIQSYLACGKPVVAALDGEGAKVVEESGAGFTISSGDAGGLAEIVQKMKVMDESKRIEMGNSAKQYYDKHFDQKQLMNQLESWMNEVIKEGLCES